MQPTPPLRQRLLPLIVLGLTTGLARYAMEFVAPEHAMWFGIYYVVGAAIVVIGLAGKWGAIRWPALLGTMALTCLVVWGVSNSLAYTTAQFEGWTHGRFAADRSPPLAETTPGKIGTGLGMGLMTSLPGTAWCTLLGTVFIWLPGRIRSRSRGPDVAR